MTVTIIYHFEEDGWWADSPDLPGWSCVGATLEETRTLAISGAREFAGDGVAIAEMLPVSAQNMDAGPVVEIFAEPTTGSAFAASIPRFGWSSGRVPPAPATVEMRESA